MKAFMDLLKTSATDETVSDISSSVMEPLAKKMEELIEQNKKSNEVSQAALTSLGIIDKRIKRMGSTSGEAASPAYQRRY